MKLFHRKPRLSSFSVKEGLDNLPSGICFAERNGTIILCNRRMYHLCHIMTGTDLQHISELYRALDAPQPAVTVIEKDAFLYRFPGGKLWQFLQSIVTDVDGNEYTQMQAIDVTELHRKRMELEHDNAELAKANARAKKLYAEMDRIVREKETLAMKMRIHDDIGLCLLATRNLLTQDGSPETCHKTKQRWEQMLRLIGIANRDSYEECPVNAEAALVELIASAGEIGVHMTVLGDLPSSGERSYLFITAMRECVTNTVRHAEGNEMTVQLIQTQKLDSVVITNNGKKPEREIIEGGGLSGLRRSVENIGGSMTVTSRPDFRLSIDLPREEKNNGKCTFG